MKDVRCDTASQELSSTGVTGIRDEAEQVGRAPEAPDTDDTWFIMFSKVG